MAADMKLKPRLHIVTMQFLQVRDIGDINRAMWVVNEDRSSPFPAGTDYDIRFGAIEGQNNVEGFPEWRKLTRIQEIMLYEQCFSVTVDNMTSFILRPPEPLVYLYNEQQNE
eukprot:4986787-Ditylum_brightwellii.AAC.1